jgi:DNA-binding PadR family transcriptional regulator
MSSDANLTPFSYVILALVGRNGAGPHDIVRMMREGAVFWTTSESHIYAEPKRLAKLGYLTAEKQPGRTRPRTHYELTDQGRSALVSWLAEPAPMPRVQNEAAVKLLAADFSDEATILASLSTLRARIARPLRGARGGGAPSAGDSPPYALSPPAQRARRRTLDTQREWLEHVERELRAPSDRGSKRSPA